MIISMCNKILTIVQQCIHKNEHKMVTVRPLRKTHTHTPSKTPLPVYMSSPTPLLHNDVMFSTKLTDKIASDHMH